MAVAKIILLISYSFKQLVNDKIIVKFKKSKAREFTFLNRFFPYIIFISNFSHCLILYLLIKLLSSLPYISRHLSNTSDKQ